MRTHAVVIAAVVTSIVAAALAADHPVEGDRLTLRDPTNVNARSVKFSASRDPNIDPTTGADPTIVGATLEFRGSGAGDGQSGVVALDPTGWEGRGRPPGSKGYRFTDRLRASGVKSVLIVPGRRGGRLTVAGGGSNWSYAVTRPQEAVDVRLTIGPDTYCARFATFVQNVAGKVRARSAPPPATCAAPAGPICGNGSAEAPEECDDGNTAPGDGCSPTCQLEDTSALCAGVPTTVGTGLDGVRVAQGLTRPVFVTAPRLDPNRLFIVEQDGLVRILDDGALRATPFLDLVDEAACCGERGLLSLAFHPDYESNGRFFVNYTNNAGDTVVARYQVSADPNVADEGTATVLLTVDQEAANHNGGQLQFGPDGYLYIGIGDGGGGGDPNERAQDPTFLLGKLLRIDVNAPTYVVPPSNPFADGGATPPRDEIWALGLRNPWRFSFDRGTGDLYIADVGQAMREEVDVQPAASTGGENYGWDVFEGDRCFEPTPPATSCPNPPTGFTAPVLVYDHGQGCSITGGYVYRGCAMPDLHGTYFYSDICTPFVRTFRGVSGGIAQDQQNRTADVAPGGGLAIGGVSSFGEDARGELYIVDYGGGAAGQGEVYRVVPGS
jgi:cysteine-rich repeat protein